MLKFYFTIGFLFFSLLALPQDSIQNTVPPEVLFKKNQQFNFSISPNGKYFAEIIENNNEIDLVFIDIDGYKLHNRISMDNTNISNVYWISNSRVIYEAYGEIYAINIDGTNGAKLVNRFAEVKRKKTNTPYYKRIQYNRLLDVLQQDNDEVLIETFDYNGYASVNRLNVFTAEKKEIISGAFHKMNSWLLDKNGKPAIGIKYEDDGWTYFVEDIKLGKWIPLHIKIEGQSYPFVVSASSYLDQNLTFVDLGYEPNIIYVTSNITTDKRILIKYNYQDQVVIQTMAQDVNCDISDADGTDLELIFDRKNREVAGLRYEGITPEYKWISTELNKVYSDIKSKYDKYFNDILDIDQNNERFLLKQWSDTYAGNIGVYDVRDGSYSVMFQFNEELNKYKLSKTRNIQIKNREGTSILGYLNLPVNYDKSSPIPLVMIPHGGPWVRDYWGLDQFAQFFASRGYAALRINYRGSAGFGRDHILAGVQGINTVMIDDIVDATNFVKNAYAIDASKIFIFGHSYGGYATYMSLIKYGDIFKSGVAVSAPTDIKAWMKIQKKEDNSFAYQFWNAALGQKDKKYFSEVSPINFVNRINTPIMVFHGKKDQIVPVEQAERMKKKFLENGKKDVFRILQNEGHSIWDSNSLGYILDQTDEFFKKAE